MTVVKDILILAVRRADRTVYIDTWGGQGKEYAASGEEVAATKDYSGTLHMRFHSRAGAEEAEATLREWSTDDDPVTVIIDQQHPSVRVVNQRTNRRVGIVSMPTRDRHG
jgi:hypothetical protein